MMIHLTDHSYEHNFWYSYISYLHLCVWGTAQTTEKTWSFPAFASVDDVVYMLNVDETICCTNIDLGEYDCI